MKRDNYFGEIYVNIVKEGFKIEEIDSFVEDLVKIELIIIDMIIKEIIIFIIGVKNILLYYVCSVCGRNIE